MCKYSTPRYTRDNGAPCARAWLQSRARAAHESPTRAPRRNAAWPVPPRRKRGRRSWRETREPREVAEKIRVSSIALCPASTVPPAMTPDKGQLARTRTKSPDYRVCGGAPGKRGNALRVGVPLKQDTEYGKSRVN